MVPPIKLSTSICDGQPNRRKVIRAVAPSCDEIVKLIIDKCSTQPPRQVEGFVVERDNGHKFFFQPTRALRKMAYAWNKPHGPSESSKERFMQLPWATDWIDLFVKGANYTRHVRAVTKDAKIMLLRIFYPSDPPSWRDEIPIGLDNGDVWIFKPVQWLDDLSDSWLRGKSAVRLSDEEKKQLEALPWVMPWIERIRERRAKRTL